MCWDRSVIRRALPRTGEELPVIGLGTWRTFDVGAEGHAARGAVLRRFVELGGRLVDTSPMYGRAEAVVGKMAHDLRLAPELFLATKVWTRGEAAGVAQMEESQARLRAARIDLMQVHNLVDVETHLRTLARWKAEGRVRYVGVTHYTVESHRELEPFLARGDVDVMQCNYSLAVPDAERRLLPMAADRGVAILVNRPFENGDVFDAAARQPLPPVAATLGCRSWAQLFLKFVISHPAVTCVIPATASVMHLEENMAAASEPLPDAAARREIAAAWRAVL